MVHVSCDHGKSGLKVSPLPPNLVFLIVCLHTTWHNLTFLQDLTQVSQLAFSKFIFVSTVFFFFFFLKGSSWLCRFLWWQFQKHMQRWELHSSFIPFCLLDFQDFFVNPSESECYPSTKRTTGPVDRRWLTPGTNQTKFACSIQALSLAPYSIPGTKCCRDVCICMEEASHQMPNQHLEQWCIPSCISRLPLLTSTFFDESDV